LFDQGSKEVISSPEELVKAKDRFIGHDIEVNEGGAFPNWRGPIKDIAIEGEMLIFTTEWSASETRYEEWELMRAENFPGGINRFISNISITRIFEEHTGNIRVSGYMMHAEIISPTRGQLDPDSLLVVTA
jgi:hypothetical protein